MPDPMLTAALAYASKGIPVFPIVPGSKEPHAGTKGLKDATTDDGILRLWWRQWPGSNLAMPTGRKSGFWVVDVDGDEGLRTLATLVRTHGGDLGEVLRVYTPRGGRHFYFPWAGQLVDQIRNSANQIGTKLDVRGEGGYVLLPPSEYNGREYLWEE